MHHHPNRDRQGADRSRRVGRVVVEINQTGREEPFVPHAPLLFSGYAFRLLAYQPSEPPGPRALINWSAAGPSSTMKIDGKMKKISGSISLTVVF